MRLAAYLIVSPVLAVTTLAQAQAATIANSISQFSLEQGRGGWFYGYYNRSADPNKTYAPTDFRIFPQHDDFHWFIDESRFFTVMTATEAHANGPVSSKEDVEHWAIRRFISPVDADVMITLTGREDGLVGGDGTVTQLLIDGEQVFSRGLANDDQTGFSVQMTESVRAGTVIDFVVQPGASDHFDCPVLISTITLVPEPSMLGLAALAGMLLMRRR